MDHFIHIPKTGMTSVLRALKIQFRRGQHMIAREAQKKFEWDVRKAYTFVRNPWDRAVSWYYWHGLDRQPPNELFKQVLTFQEWIREGCPAKLAHAELGYNPIDQLAYLTDSKGQDLVAFIGRFERLREDAIELGKFIGRKCDKLERWQASKRPSADYRKLYDDETAELLAKMTPDFIRRFEYEF